QLWRSRSLHRALNNDCLTKRRCVGCQPHDCLLRILRGIDMRRMCFHTDLCSARAAESRDTARQSEFDRVHDAAFASAIRPLYAEVLLAEIKHELSDAAKLNDLNIFNPNHFGAPRPA